MSSQGNPQLQVGPNDSSTLITDTDTFNIARINFSGDNTGIALSVSGIIESTGNVFIGVTSGNSIGTSNVPLNIGQTGNIVVGSTGYFMGTVSTNNAIVHDTIYMGNPNTLGSFKFVRDPIRGYLRIFLFNTTTNLYELSMRLEHFC